MDLSEAVAGRLLFTVFGVGGTLVSGLLLYFVKEFFKSRKENSQENQQKIEETEKQSEKSDEKLLSEMKEMRSEFGQKLEDLRERQHSMELKFTQEIGEVSRKLEASTTRLDASTKEVHKLEGRITEHMQSINRFTEEMRSVNEKFAAVFRYMDAAKRASDVSDKAEGEAHP